MTEHVKCIKRALGSCLVCLHLYPSKVVQLCMEICEKKRLTAELLYTIFPSSSYLKPIVLEFNCRNNESNLQAYSAIN
jgi:hypothetical protein